MDTLSWYQSPDDGKWYLVRDLEDNPKTLYEPSRYSYGNTNGQLNGINGVANDDLIDFRVPGTTISFTSLTGGKTAQTTRVQKIKLADGSTQELHGYMGIMIDDIHPDDLAQRSNDELNAIVDAYSIDTWDSATPYKPITLGDLQDPARGGFSPEEIESLKIEIADGVEIDNIVDYFVYNFRLPGSIITNIFAGNYYSRGWTKIESGTDFMKPVGRVDGSHSIPLEERFEVDLNGFLQEQSLIMYSDDTILDDVIDIVDDIIDLTGSASFFFFVGFNTVIWWGKIGMFALRVFTSAKAIVKEYFDL